MFALLRAGMVPGSSMGSFGHQWDDVPSLRNSARMGLPYSETQDMASDTDQEVLATRIDIGPREEQQDRAVSHINTDGSWVIAVFDGLGGHARGSEAAQAAADVLPQRISGREAMREALNTANDAVWALLPEKARVPRRFGAPFPGQHEPLTTIAVAAWTSVAGLQVAWVGDSVLFFVPLNDRMPGLHSQPHGSWDSHLLKRIAWVVLVMHR